MTRPRRRRRCALSLAALAALGAACGGDDDAARVPDFPARLPLVWVDPARCLPVCAHESEGDLVRVDASAALQAAGAFEVRDEAQAPLAALVRAAAGAGHRLAINSAHRTYAEQGALWDMLSTTEPGRAARPGHSEHEAGLAVDLAFSSDAAVTWTADNAWRFGFVLSYPQLAQKVTGFRYEPWHFRFVGSAVAAQLHASPGETLEELFRQTPGLGLFGDCGDCPLPASRSDCAAVTAAGACAGEVLTWCFDGAAAAVDCATSELTCLADSGSGARCGTP